MAARCEFFFDYGSPHSYLADSQLVGLASRTGAEVVHRPMLLGGVFKATGNQSPAFESVEAKRSYGGTVLRRYVSRYGVPFRGNPFFPINTLGLMRGAVAAQRRDEFAAYHPAVFAAFWVEGLDLGDAEVVARVLAGAGLDAAVLLAAAGDPDVKRALRENTEEAVARGAFGAPTFFVGDEMFFGNDHIPFLEETLCR